MSGVQPKRSTRRLGNPGGLALMRDDGIGLERMLARGTDVDKSRNLAKSVTVE